MCLTKIWIMCKTISYIYIYDTKNCIWRKMLNVLMKITSIIIIIIIINTRTISTKWFCNGSSLDTANPPSPAPACDFLPIFYITELLFLSGQHRQSYSISLVNHIHRQKNCERFKTIFFGITKYFRYIFLHCHSFLLNTGSIHSGRKKKRRKRNEY